MESGAVQSVSLPFSSEAPQFAPHAQNATVATGAAIGLGMRRSRRTAAVRVGHRQSLAAAGSRTLRARTRGTKGDAAILLRLAWSSEAARAFSSSWRRMTSSWGGDHRGRSEWLLVGARGTRWRARPHFSGSLVSCVCSISDTSTSLALAFRSLAPDPGTRSNLFDHSGTPRDQEATPHWPSSQCGRAVPSNGQDLRTKPGSTAEAR